MNYGSRQSGFTLLELMVVVSIMALLFALSIPAFRSFERNARVRETTKGLRSIMWEAQNLALAPSHPDITAYTITLAKGQSTLQPVVIQAVGKSGVDYQLPSNTQPYRLLGDVVIEDITLDGNTVPGATATVSFLADNKHAGTVQYSQPGETLRIHLSSQTSQLEYDVVIDKSSNTIDFVKSQ